MSDFIRYGIDISVYQPNIDWSHVTAHFVIARAGYGKSAAQKDKLFDSHYENAKKNGIPVGAYWYSYAMTEDDARAEADACIAVLKGKQLEYPIYYDVEEEKQFKLGREKLSAIIRAFLERLEAAGYWVGLYSSYSALVNYVSNDIRDRYAIWLAHWNVEKSPYTGQYGMWQYKVAKADGVPGDCDLDKCYYDYPTAIKERGLNGFQKPEKPPENPSEPDPDPDSGITVEMTIDGKKYSGTLTAK